LSKSLTPMCLLPSSIRW